MGTGRPEGDSCRLQLRTLAKTTCTVFWAGKLRGQVAVVLLLDLSDLSAFPLISDSGLLLIRPVRTCATPTFIWGLRWEQLWGDSLLEVQGQNRQDLERHGLGQHFCLLLWSEKPSPGFTLGDNGAEEELLVMKATIKSHGQGSEEMGGDLPDFPRVPRGTGHSFKEVPCVYPCTAGGKHSHYPHFCTQISGDIEWVFLPWNAV